MIYAPAAPAFATRPKSRCPTSRFVMRNCHKDLAPITVFSLYLIRLRKNPPMNDDLLVCHAACMEMELHAFSVGEVVMRKSRILLCAGLAGAVLVQSGCGAFGNRENREPVNTPPAEDILYELKYGDRKRPRGTIWDIFRSRPDQGRLGAVNKYIWNASLETLDFLPVQSVDPFTGVITTGYGTPPGGGKAYRATVLISDPALDARSLNLALMTRNGPAPAATVRAIEDAILTRARQLRQQDSKL